MSDTDAGQTYYTLLKVEEDATDAEVRKAYLRRAAECHPDKHPEDEGATERFQALGEAYECLKDPIARTEYDRKLRHIRQSDSSRSTTGSPPQADCTRDHAEFRGFSRPFAPPPPHHRPHPRDRLAFFRATGFSPFSPFSTAFHEEIGSPSPLAMFAEFMVGLSGPGGSRPEQEIFGLHLGHNHKRRPFPQGPLGPIDPFDHPLLGHPFRPLGATLPPSHFPPRPHPRSSARHHHPYPFPPGPVPLTRHHPESMMGGFGATPAGVPPQGLGGGWPGRCHRATFELKDPAGRTTGFIHQSSMSWSTFK